MGTQRTDFAPTDLGDRETTLLVKSLLIPRPIAWVGTCSADGVANLAPPHGGGEAKDSVVAHQEHVGTGSASPSSLPKIDGS